MAAVFLCVATLIGCQPAYQGPAPISFSLSQPETLGEVNRVVFVALDSRGTSPELTEEMTLAVAHAIQSRQLFRLDVIDRSEYIARVVPEDYRSGLTLKQMKEMRDAFKCDAVLLGTVTNFRPHPRTQLGLTLSLLDLKMGRQIWGVDHFWNTSDKAVEKRGQAYFNEVIRTGFEPINWRIIQISPREFAKFVAFEVGSTLPNRAQLPTRSEVILDATLEKMRKTAKNL